MTTKSSYAKERDAIALALRDRDPSLSLPARLAEAERVLAHAGVHRPVHAARPTVPRTTPRPAAPRTADPTLAALLAHKADTAPQLHVLLAGYLEGYGDYTPEEQHAARLAAKQLRSRANVTLSSAQQSGMPIVALSLRRGRNQIERAIDHLRATDQAFAKQPWESQVRAAGQFVRQHAIV